MKLRLFLIVALMATVAFAWGRWTRPMRASGQAFGHPDGIAVRTINLNAAGTDNLVVVPYSRYIIRRITVIPNSSLGAISTCTLGVFTGAGGTGTTVATATTLSGLTSSAKYTDMTLALGSDVMTSTSLWVRVVVPQGSAATGDVYVSVDPLD